MNKITLWARIRKGESEYKLEKVSTERNGKPIQPQEPENVSRYYFRYTEPVPGSTRGKQVTKAASKGFADAVKMLRYKELELEAAARGLDVPMLADSRPTIARAADQFLKNIATLGKSPSTIYSYTHALDFFKQSCFRVHLDEVLEQDIYNHIAWLLKHVPSRAKEHGYQRNGMVRTHLNFLKAFFLHNGKKFPLPQKLWPKIEERPVEAYTPEQLEKLLSEVTDDEKDLILFMVCTGFRDNEAAHSVWDDVDFRAHTIKVGPKPEMGFTTKNGKVRLIPVPSELLERLRERHDRQKEGALIFPNGKGGADSCLLARCRNAAKRAGYSGRVTLHKFRKTFGTRFAEKHGVRNAQMLLGHESITTTEKYLAETKIARSAVEALFEDVVGK
jgi:integrase